MRARPVQTRQGTREDGSPGGGSGRLLRSRALWLLLALALALDVWGNRWGLFNAWHGDELSWTTEQLVRARQLNPHYFMYGNIAFYRTALGVGSAIGYTRLLDPPPTRSDAAAYDAWSDRYAARIAAWPRVVSAVEGVLVVLVTFVIGALLFDRRVGLLGGALVALSPVIVYIAHVATADGFANLAYWVACLAAILSWRRGSTRWLALSLLLAGVAMGAKTDRLLVVVPVAVAYAWRADRHWRHVPLLLLLVAGYVLANPVLLIQPFEFLDGLTRDMFFGVVQDEGTERPYLLLLEYMWTGAGRPSATVAAAAVAFALARIVQGRERRELVWLLSTFLPYVLLLGTRTVFPWYVGQLLPGLLLVAAWALVHLLDAVPRRYALAGRAGVAVLLLLALLGPISLDLQFTHDPRDEASRWIAANVPTRTAIFVSERGPYLPRGRYRVERMLPDRERWTENMTRPRERLDRHPVYRGLRRAILASERWAGRTLGTPVRAEPYRGWYDVVHAELDARPAATGRVQAVRPDYVVIVEGMSPTVHDWIRSAGSSYLQVAGFPRYRSPVRPELRMPMLNKEVHVFRRRDTPPPVGP